RHRKIRLNFSSCRHCSREGPVEWLALQSPSDHDAGNSELLLSGAVERGAGHRKGGAVDDFETCLDGERRGMLGAVHEIDVIWRRAVRGNVHEDRAAGLEAAMGEAPRPGLRGARESR